VLSWIVESWEFSLINTLINYISGKQNGTPTTKWNSLIGIEQLINIQMDGGEQRPIFGSKARDFPLCLDDKSELWAQHLSFVCNF
jgi:hypothetical protein